MQIALFALALTGYASFLWGAIAFFHKTGPLPQRTIVLSSAGVLGMLVHGAALAIGFLSNRAEYLATAFALYCGSLVVFWWAVRTARHARLAAVFSEHSSVQVVTRGPYQIVRHPFYLAYLMSWIGGGLAVGTLWAWAVVAVMAVLYAIAIRHEEQQLLSGPLASEYAAYQQQVGRLFPRLLRSAIAKS